jgi:hypothetical protein
MVNLIYSESDMSIKIDGADSCIFCMKRGVHQGCLLSPLLFLLFINHILCETVPDGFSVPGLGWQRCSRGAMYANDLLCLVDEPEQA